MSAARANDFADASYRSGQGNAHVYTWPNAGLDWSQVETRALTLSVADAGAPGVPTGLAAAPVGGTKLELSWQAPADPGPTAIAGYRIEWSADGAEWRELAPNTGETAGARCDGAAPASGAAYCATGLPRETVRHYRVSAVNGHGPGSPSDPVRATTGTGAPDAPGGLTATADGAHRIEIAWNAPAGAGDAPVEGYRVEWSSSALGPWQVLVADTGTGPGETCAGAAPASGLAHCDAGLASPTERHYRAIARNAFGEGPASEPASATTDDETPPVLGGALVAPTGDRILLSFGEALGSGAASPPPAAFTVRVDGVETAIGALAGNPVNGTLVLDELSPVVRRGRAVVVTYTDPSDADDAAALQDDDGNDAASFTTGADGVPAVANNSTRGPEAPGAPTGLEATAATDASRIDLAWAPPADDGGETLTG